MTNKPQKEK